MTIFQYVARRLAFIVPQLLGIVAVSFFLVSLIPGDPAVLMLGPLASQDSIAKLHASLGLNQPLAIRFLHYVWRLLHGDLGTSWQTQRPVLLDLLQRAPATIELVTYSLLVAIAVGIPLGVYTAVRTQGIPSKIATMYGSVAGTIPDFWLGLVFIFIFYNRLHAVPAPTGRLDLAIPPPPTITGFYTIDGLLTGDWTALGSALAHLALPALTLGLINAGPIFAMTRSTVSRMLDSNFAAYAQLSGLPRSLIIMRAFRNAFPSIVTVISVLYGFLIGGAVLIEFVFSWGGAGQYAVQGVLNADIDPVLGFVLFSAIFSLVIYLAVDLIYFALDPRVRR